ncbi:hypothetical protein JOF29_005623 [Kribbella aluminosa]|uniref:HEAT repeat protein n=1 Tax=Kribbella aluminosa TaxID=416017 RepID=A0ABS4USB3_9ACTN|nr:DUF5691 domain-containing protein [Kribbella aluminosa]MBP2354513.1 hypothetical protein [Kribbella aluminosa]
MKGWDGLVSSVLLGTDRRPADFDELPEYVRERLGDGGLLDAAALATVYKRAGRKPLRELTPLEPAGGEDRPLPRPGAVRRLAAMLGGFQTAALGEWLRTAEANGWGVPPEHLPALADYARNRAEYRPLVIAAAGRRARWLAELNPEWRFLHAADAESNDPELWTHGNAIQRRAWLLGLRRREPGAARAELAEVWPNESAATRADFLGLFAEGLSLADEEFLETGLDDRSREVRRVAARMLARLAEAQYGVRMTERLRSHLVESQGVLAVDLPRSLTASMERDGLDSQNPEGVGKRAWWFHQIVANTPLSAMHLTWLETPVEGCAPEVLQSAWTEATVREGAAAAARPSAEPAEADGGEALASRWARALLLANANTGSRNPAELLRLLPPVEWARAVEVMRGSVDVAELVGGLPVPWPPELARMILDQLVRVGTNRAWARLASIAARAVPPDVLDHPITRDPTGDEDTWRRRLVETLTFRHEMHEELT